MTRGIVRMAGPEPSHRQVTVCAGAGTGFGALAPAAYHGDGSMVMYVVLLAAPGARKEGRGPAPLLTAYQ